MEGIVNILGALTALCCSVLLYRGYRRTSARLLCLGAICFLALGIENGIVFVDRFIVPETDLILIRHSVAIIGLSILVFGLIWDSY